MTTGTYTRSSRRLPVTGLSVAARDVPNNAPENRRPGASRRRGELLRPVPRGVRSRGRKEIATINGGFKDGRAQWRVTLKWIGYSKFAPSWRDAERWMPANGGTPTVNSAATQQGPESAVFRARIFRSGAVRVRGGGAQMRPDIDPLGMCDLLAPGGRHGRRIRPPVGSLARRRGKVGTVLRETCRIADPTVLGLLRHFDLVTDKEVEAVGFVEAIDRWKGDPNPGGFTSRSTDGRPAGAGIGKSGKGALAIPYAKVATDIERSPKGEPPPQNALTEEA